MRKEKIYYGDHSDQFIINYKNEDKHTNKEVIILIHGGYWRDKINYEYLDNLAAEMIKADFNTYSIEYRRGWDHQWPIPLQDVKEAIKIIKSKNKDSNLLTIGHSVGGQLALLTSNLVDYTISLAPVTDVNYTYKHGLGENAVSDYFENPDDTKYLSDASPINYLPLNSKKNLIIHGINDDRVKIKTTLDYLAKSLEFKNNIELLLIPEMCHLEICEPNYKHIDYIIKWIKSI